MKRLVIRPGAIGDCILALPAIEHLRPAEVWVARQNVPLIRFAPAAAIADTGLDLAGIPELELPRGLVERLGGFDEIVSWYGSSRPEFRAAVSGFPFRFLAALPEGVWMHAADFFLTQVGGPTPGVPRIPVARAGTSAGSAGRIPCATGCVVIHPFSGSARKNWPLERFRELAERIDTSLFWCAGPEERFEGAERFEDLYELACWLAGARVYIGNDSGITHLAAAAGTPVLALFGPTDPWVWAPRGEQVRVLTEMENVSVEEALKAARDLL